MRVSFALLIVIGLITGCGASVRAMDVSQVPSFTIASINTSSEETLGKVMTTGTKAMVVILKRGDRVPVKLHASLGPIALQPGEDYLVFSQDTYLYIGPTGILLSPDGKQWAPVQDGAALGKVFGLGRGTLQIGFGAPKGQPATFSIAMERQ